MTANPERSLIKEQSCFGGLQSTYSHFSHETQTLMRYAVYQPPAALRGKHCPTLTFLSGLTCTEENFAIKAGAQRVAAELGILLVMPDTSPRGAGIPGEDESYDFGSGAGFYVDATVDPWSTNYRMYSYVTEELPEEIAKHFPVDTARSGIFGHSMGGHGALVMAFRNPDKYRSVSAFAPICAPSQVPWGQKAFSGYLGDDKAQWARYDATELLDITRWKGPLLIDQGAQDEFLDRELRPMTFAARARAAGVRVDFRMHEGYDHSYFFIATFVEDHLRFHAKAFRR